MLTAMLRSSALSEQISIAVARDQLARIVHRAERGERITITRRDKPVAVLISADEYARLRKGRPGFWNACEELRREFADVLLDEECDPFEGIRDRSPGREVSL